MSSSTSTTCSGSAPLDQPRENLSTNDENTKNATATQGVESGGNLLEGTFDEAGGHQSFLEAREEFLRSLNKKDVTATHTSSSTSSSASTHMATSATSAQPSLSSGNGGGGMLWEGSFDEKGGHESFLEARQAFLDSMPQSDEHSMTTILPSVPTANFTATAKDESEKEGGGMLLEGIYDEEANAKAFQEVNNCLFVSLSTTGDNFAMLFYLFCFVLN